MSSLSDSGDTAATGSSDPTEWQFVHHNKGRKRPLPLKCDAKHDYAEPQLPRCGAEELQRKFGEFWKRWHTGEFATVVRQRLAAVKKRFQEAPEDGEGGYSKITNALCLGLGTLSGERSELHMTHRFWQLAYFIELLMAVTESDFRDGSIQTTVKLYTCEPEFNAIDAEFLNRCGFTNLTITESSFKVGRGSMLFSAYVPWRTLLHRTLRHAMPTLYVGPEMLTTLELREGDLSDYGADAIRRREQRPLSEETNLKEFSVSEALPVARNLIEGRDLIRFKLKSYGNALDGMHVFLPKEDTSN